MKTLNKNEMRKVEGGYRLYCTNDDCNETSGSIRTRLGVTLFYLAHKHGTKGGYAAYDFSYRNAMKWNS